MSVALQEDGKIVAAGYAYNGSNSDFALARCFGGNDATPPTVSAPVQKLISGSALATNNKVPVRLSWSGSDAQSGIARYQLQQKISTGSYTNVPLSSMMASTETLSLSPNKTYKFRVRTLDNNGNWSTWKTGPRFTANLRQENGVGVSYPSGTWKQQNISSASGSALEYATTKGATARFIFKGRNVAWVAPKSNARGKAEMYLDGVKVATVDLYSSKVMARKVVYATNGLNPSTTHTLMVKVLGTKRAASSGVWVDVDAFVVLR